MKQIKLFTNSDANRLEENANEWLTENENCNIMEFQYQSSLAPGGGTFTSPIIRHSVMIVYIKD